MLVVGIDGCKGGWLFSVLSTDDHLQMLLFPFLSDAIAHLLNADAISIDMPMGLISDAGEKRICDALIRKELGHPFSSSVFNVPCKQAVYANNYQEANRLNHKLCGKRLSVQLWNIVPKIRELDIILAEYPSLKKKIHESHPELCFKQLRGEPLVHKKKTAQGKEERIALLKGLFPDIKNEFLTFRKLYLKKNVADDDILDSMVLAHNAQQIASGNYKQFPKDDIMDKNEVKMAVRVFNVL